MSNKPEYKIPTMASVRRMKPNGFKVASTFSGCGGSSLGYRMAGFKVVYANEFVPAARECYKENCHKDTHVDDRDIRKVSVKDFLKRAGVKKGELDLLDGSPPCASFSTSGTRDKGWGEVKKYSDTEQRTDDLFYEFIRLLKGAQPKTFVAENVSGLVKGKAKGYFLNILRELEDAGYEVQAQVLDAQWLGVPQCRQRLIFVGVRKDLCLRKNVKPAHPKPFAYQYSVRDVLPHLVREKRGGTPENWQRTTRPASTIMASGAGLSPTAYLSGGTYVEELKDGKRIQRKFTIPELRKVCSFPPDFKLTGTFEQQWERMGRSVPPLMMRAIATTIRDEILNQL